MQACYSRANSQPHFLNTVYDKKKSHQHSPIAWRARVDLIAWFSDQCVHQLNCVFACAWVCVFAWVYVSVCVCVCVCLCVCLQELYSECKGISWPIDFSISCTAARNKSSLLLVHSCSSTSAVPVSFTERADDVYLTLPRFSTVYIPPVSTRAR